MSSTNYMSYLPILLLLLLPSPIRSLMCSQCQEITVNGVYYDEEPRDCLDPDPIECSPGEDRCISAGVTFQLIADGASSTIDFGIKYCGNREVSCEQIEGEMRETVDYGVMNGFQCHIGTKCEADECNRLVPLVLPESWNTVTKPGFSTTNEPQSNEPEEYAVNEVEVDTMVEIVDINETEVELEGNDQAVTASGQSKNFLQSSILVLSFLCGVILLQF